MVTILDYGAGNLTSVRLAFERLGETPTLITRADEWRGGRIVFPGVGSAASGMAGLRARGFDTLLRRAADEGVPILGVCLGMQLLLEGSEEDGGVEGLGLIPGRCVRFDPMRDPTAKIPHMGWNTVDQTPHPLWAGIPNGAAFYFVHSFFVRPAAEADVALVNTCSFLASATEESVDYPDKAREACLEYRKGGYDFGVLCCGTGIGISMAANKVRGIRCALVGDRYSAEMTRRHNNPDFIAFGGRVDYRDSIEDMLDAFIDARFEGGRHEKRIEKLMALEEL